MARYSKTGADFFLALPIDEFCRWVELINGEIKREEKAAKK